MPNWWDGDSTLHSRTWADWDVCRPVVSFEIRFEQGIRSGRLPDPSRSSSFGDVTCLMRECVRPERMLVISENGEYTNVAATARLE